MLAWLRSSAVRVLKIRPGRAGRYRWIGVDSDGNSRAMPTPVGWVTPEEAAQDGLAVFPRAKVRYESEKDK